ncbi:MAG TPA: hypothetical protein PLI99_00940 [archaeon]|nr:hypothetical protein [archaeon]
MKKIILLLVVLALFFGCVEKGSNSVSPDILKNEGVGYDQNLVSDSNSIKTPLKSGYAISDDENFILADSIRLKAIKEKNAEICKQIDYLSVKENCFLNVALITKDISVCESLDFNHKLNCMNLVKRRI